MSKPTPTPAEALRAVIDEHGLTQPEVAALAGVHLKTVASWLAGPDAASHRNMASRHLRTVLLALPRFLAAHRRAAPKKKET